MSRPMTRLSPMSQPTGGSLEAWAPAAVDAGPVVPFPTQTPPDGPLGDAVRAAMVSALDDGLDRGLIRIIAHGPDSPIVTAILDEAGALPEDARPEVHLLFWRGDAGPEGADSARRLEARGAAALREQALFGGARLWVGAPIGQESLAVSEGRLKILFDPEARTGRRDALDLARLTFGSAWALSADPNTPVGWAERFTGMVRSAVRRFGPN